jgi:hypothetical protein
MNSPCAVKVGLAQNWTAADRLVVSGFDYVGDHSTQPVLRSGCIWLRVCVGRPVKFRYLSAQHEPERDVLPCGFASPGPWHATAK